MHFHWITVRPSLYFIFFQLSSSTVVISLIHASGRISYLGREIYALVIGFLEGGGGGPQADVGTLRIVHFKVLVFLGIFFLPSPLCLAKPSTQLDLKMHLRTLLSFFEQLANTRT